MPENNDILFDDYLTNQLPVNESNAFEQRLLIDAEFKQEFELHQQVVNGIILKGEQDLRSELTSIYNTNLPEIESKKYEPGIGGNGFSFASFFFKLFFVSVLLFLISTALIVKNKFPVHHPKVETYKNWTQEIQRKYFTTRVDTVYYEVRSADVKKGDTIIDFPDKRIIKSNSKSDTLLKNK